MPLQLEEKVKELGSRAQAQLTEQFAPVSYTHLTLPTIRLV